MTIVIVLLALLGLAVTWLLMSARATAARREARLLRELQAADRQVAEAHRRARRAMNGAVGQSWRNPFE